MKIDSAYYTKEKDILIIQYPIDKYDIEEMQSLAKAIKEAFPENEAIFMPEDISISLIREENPFL